jgi:hypothetical protein
MGGELCGKDTKKDKEIRKTKDILSNQAVRVKKEKNK